MKLGAGFSFIARQKRIQVDNDDFYIDLLFFNNFFKSIYWQIDIKELQNKVVEFRDRRECAQYHNPKDLAISLSLEAAELLEIFQWKDAGEVDVGKSDEEIRRRVKEELGDILIYALTLAHEFTLNPADIILDKLQIIEDGIPFETKMTEMSRTLYAQMEESAKLDEIIR